MNNDLDKSWLFCQAINQMIHKIASIFIFAFLVFTQGVSIQGNAHPLPSGVNHNTYFTVQNEVVTLKYELLMFYEDLPIFFEPLDPNGDRVITEQESQTWLTGLDFKVYLELNGQEYRPQRVTNFVFEEDVDDLLYPRILFDLEFPQISIPDSPTQLVIHNTYRIQSDDEQDWNFAHNDNVFAFTGYGFPEGDRLIGTWSKILNPEYNQQSTNDSSWRDLFSTDRNNIFIQSRNTLEEGLQNDTTSPIVILTLAAIAFVFGMAHTLTPGHGKAIISAYMAAIRGTFKDAVIMATSTTLSHTGIVILIGFLFVFLRNGLRLIIPLINISITLPAVNVRQFLPYLPTISGIAIICIGLWMFRKRLLQFIANRTHQHQHTHDIEHDHGHLHESHDLHSHSHTHHGHSHDIPDHRLTLKEAVWLGFSTGLNPCIDAIAILILALNIDKPLLGIGIILIFSIGMATTLVTLGWSVGKGLTFGSSKVPWGKQFMDWLPMISSLLIALVGLLLII